MFWNKNYEEMILEHKIENMWNKIFKKQNTTSELSEVFEKVAKELIESNTEDKFAACSDCGAVYEKDKLQHVVEKCVFLPTLLGLYCENCKKPYDRVEDGRRYKTFEVDEKGNIIKNK